jgi:hypothetical protein
MRKRTKSLYHTIAAAVLFTRTFFVEALCPDCTFDKGTGETICCERHHEKMFDLDGRALEHFDKIH